MSGLIDLAEVGLRVNILDHVWRGYVLDNDDPEKLGRIRVLIPRIFDHGTTEGDYSKYPWVEPSRSDHWKIPEKREEVSVWFPTPDPHNIVYGPPTLLASTLPSLRDAGSIRDRNNFLNSIKRYREEGAEAPSLDLEEGDENETPLLPETFFAEVDEEQSIKSKQASDATPIEIVRKAPTLAGESLPETIAEAHEEGYPQIDIAGGDDRYIKVNRANGSIEAFLGSSHRADTSINGLGFFRDRYGNTFLQTPRLDINPTPEFKGPGEEGNVDYFPAKGRRAINGGNYVSKDVYVNGYPVVLGGGGGSSSYWTPRPVLASEVPATTDISPFDFKVTVSHVNGRWVPSNRDEIFTLEEGGQKDVWIRVSLGSDREITGCVLEMGDRGSMPVPTVVGGDDQVPEFSAFLLFEISANADGVNYDYPTGYTQFAAGPLTFLMQITDIGNAGVFWEGKWFTGG